MKLVLASASPRRAELLTQMGLAFEVNAVDIDESVLNKENPVAYVSRLATEKASAARRRYDDSVIALGSDTAVVLNDKILGKPVNKAHAVEMLSALSGRTHTVLTAVALIGKEQHCVVCESNVTFEALSAAEIDGYWSTGEPKDKAGGYGIQGKAAVFIKRIEGSFSGVMGLPIYETHQLLKNEGFV